MTNCFAKRGGKELASATWGECTEGEDEEGEYFEYKPVSDKTHQGDLKSYRKKFQSVTQFSQVL